jgi:hypothetical protein
MRGRGQYQGPETRSSRYWAYTRRGVRCCPGAQAGWRKPAALPRDQDAPEPASQPGRWEVNRQQFRARCQKQGAKFVTASSWAEFPSSAATRSSDGASPTTINSSPNCRRTSALAIISIPPRTNRVADALCFASNPSWRTVRPSAGLFVTTRGPHEDPRGWGVRPRVESFPGERR